MPQKKNSPGCKCCAACVLLSSAVKEATAALEWPTLVSGSFTLTNQRDIKTSISDSLILWHGDYVPSVGVRIQAGLTTAGANGGNGPRYIFDYVDSSNYHFVEVYDKTYAAGTGWPSLPGTAWNGQGARMYKRTAGVNTLLYDFPHASNFFSFGACVTSAGIAIGGGGGFYPTTFHGGTKLGLGTGTISGETRFQDISIAHVGGGIGCSTCTNTCIGCLGTVWDMRLTLKMSSGCSGGALVATDFILPFIGAGGGICTWRLDDPGLPCGMTSLSLMRNFGGATACTTPTADSYTLEPVPYPTGIGGTRYLMFNAPASPVDGCIGPYPVDRTFAGDACEYLSGFGQVGDARIDVTATKIQKA